MDRKILIISDSCTDKLDEGMLKVSTKLCSKLKEKDDAYFISLSTKTSLADEVVNIKYKLKLIKRFFAFAEYKKVLLFTNDINNIKWWLMGLFLSVVLKKEVAFLISEQLQKLTYCKKLFFKLYKPKLFVLSENLKNYWTSFYYGNIEVIKCGVDTQKFHAVDPENKLRIRLKYNLPTKEPIFLHVGHLTKTRRLDWMLEVPDNIYAVLVVSSYWEINTELYDKLKIKKNIIILTEYFENVEELFQAADVYVFTPLEFGAIDAPLSVFEAMACNKYIVATRHGALKEIEEGNGLSFVSGEDPIETVKTAVELLNVTGCYNREKILEYDWDNAVTKLIQWRKDCEN